MTKRILDAVDGIKDKNIDSFEEFFFLTHKGIYQILRAGEEEEETIWEYLKNVYVSIWKDNSLLPEQGKVEEWYRQIVAHVSGKSLEEVPDKGKVIPSPNLDERFESFFIEIEDELGFLEAEGSYMEEMPAPNSRMRKEGSSIWKTVFFAFVLLAISAFLVFAVMEASKKDAATLLKTDPMTLQSSKAAETTQETTKAENANNAEAAAFGWNKYKDGWKYKKENGEFILENWLEEDGKLYYLNESGYMVTGEVHLGSQNFTFLESGELAGITRFTYDIEQSETDLGRQLTQQGMPDLKNFIVDNSIVNQSGWIYYLSKENENSLPDFYRLQDGVGVLEELAKQVNGYVIVGEHAWYYKDEKMQYFMTLNRAGAATENAMVTDSEERYILKDADGNQVSHQESESIQIGPRIYNLQNGAIVSVDRIPTKLGPYTFVRSNVDKDNNIYTEDGKIFLTQGYWITDMALVGNELYYSTIIRFDSQGRPVSRLYKMDVNTKERQAISGIFEGRVNKMYYYPENAAILMEYAPIGGEHTFGRVLEYNLNDKKTYIINDEAQRGQIGSSDLSRLRVITTSGNALYCYVEEGTYNAARKDMDVRSTRTLQLDLQNKAEIPQQ